MTASLIRSFLCKTCGPRFQGRRGSKVSRRRTALHNRLVLRRQMKMEVFHGTSCRASPTHLHQRRTYDEESVSFSTSVSHYYFALACQLIVLKASYDCRVWAKLGWLWFRLYMLGMTKWLLHGSLLASFLSLTTILQAVF